MAAGSNLLQRGFISFELGLLFFLAARDFQYGESGIVLDYGKGEQCSTLYSWARCVG
jgi:hypothetical protein